MTAVFIAGHNEAIIRLLELIAAGAGYTLTEHPRAAAVLVAEWPDRVLVERASGQGPITVSKPFSITEFRAALAACAPAEEVQ